MPAVRNDVQAPQPPRSQASRPGFRRPLLGLVPIESEDQIIVLARPAEGKLQFAAMRSTGLRSKLARQSPVQPLRAEGPSIRRRILQGFCNWVLHELAVEWSRSKVAGLPEFFLGQVVVASWML